jgi:Uma2 family endonuclease
MSTVVEAAPAKSPPMQHLVLGDIRWEQFVTITDALGERSGLRIAYDGERLELMTLSRRHERLKKLLGRLIEQLTLELNIPCESGGQTTFRSELVQRGLEPDQCYWVQHAEELVGVDDWDPAVHPPPDLAVEVDVTHSALNRSEIYATLGIPELWRYDGETLDALQLGADGAYSATPTSRAFPFLQVASLQPFLHSADRNETSIVNDFVAWVREQGFSRS